MASSNVQPFNNPQRELGRTGVKLPATGLGLMGMSEFYGPSDDKKSQDVMREAIKLGCTFWDTSDLYGNGHNETLIAPILKESRDKVFICTKFGFERGPNGEITNIRGDREFVLQACEKSLQRLGINQIDLYYQHRVDDKTPIEETVGAMKELQDAGKVRFLGLSECSPETLERALKVARIDAVQIEYSPWETTPERSGLLDIIKKNHITLVAYSPLGRGMLTGAIKSPEDLPPDDFRATLPRFKGDAFKLNMKLVDRLGELARQKSKALGQEVTPAQFCLAWVLAQGPEFFVIPGTRSTDRLKENLGAGRVLESFTKEDDAEVRKLIKEIDVVGERYEESQMGIVGR
ncbi:hypothetical protein FRC03_000258 [Tulasnella sp. 419]|nr:hypothetical protein FRC02_009096 [Tulasnella sp. 418]KAG8965718.1 hypothetical protein FRC03_000258 [Tulasnella sp. 419]